MDILSFLEQIVRDLLIFVGVCLALLVVLLIVVARLPRDNPLRQLLSELCRHLAVTLVAGAVAIPIEPIPGLDVAYDTVVPLALLYYWGRFAWRVFASRTHRNAAPPAGGQSTS
jgi:glucan phosphoethanolaminetransferase (alkaline phosphatase superfamily)